MTGPNPIKGEATPKWIAERSEQVLHLLQEPQQPAKAKPRQIPPFRSMPPQQEPAIRILPITKSFDTGGLPLQLTDVRIHTTGVAFGLIATDHSRKNLDDKAALPNLSHRIMPFQRHRIRLVIDVPGAGMVTNAANLFDFPDDPTAPWLTGGSNYGHASNEGAVLCADYFLSPIPADSGDIVITIAYPELGLEPCCVVIDSSTLTEAATR